MANSPRSEEEDVLMGGNAHYYVLIGGGGHYFVLMGGSGHYYVLRGGNDHYYVLMGGGSYQPVGRREVGQQSQVKDVNFPITRGT